MGIGLVASLACPGGNVTGLSFSAGPGAKALSLTIPPALLLRADEIIE